MNVLLTGKVKCLILKKQFFHPQPQRSSRLIVWSNQKDINKDNEPYSFFKQQLYKLCDFLDYKPVSVSGKSCLTTKWMFVK